MVREGDAKRMLVDTAALIRAADGTPHAIDYFTASPDGSKVAVGISTGGSEDSRLTVLDAATGRTLAGPLDRAQFGGVGWLEDGSGLFMTRLQKLGPDAPATAKYKNVSADFWSLEEETVALVGAAVGKGPITNEDEGPVIVPLPGSETVLLIAFNGVQNEVPLWWGDGAAARRGEAEWRPVATAADAITRASANGSRLFLMTHKDAPTYKVLSLPIGGRLADAREVIAARPDRLIESIAAASDGLYVAAREGLWSRLLRVGNDGAVSELALPFKGSIVEITTDATRPGAIVGLNGWTHPTTHFRYDPSAAGFADLKLGIAPPIDQSRYLVAELAALAKDGTKVPLSVIVPAGPRKPRPMLLNAYGAYGIPNFPFFGTRLLAFIDAGGGRAECAVRGGGELGEAWRLAGKGPTKPNTWGDFIACAEALIAEGYTTRDMLTIQGTSAGGIAVGRAATDRPELFAGAVARVGDVNALRMELQPAGPANIPEFGTVKDPQGFKDLHAMDVYQHVRAGVRYPAFLITGGLNDPRVEAWQGAKLAARLQAIPGNRPALFRLEESAGHGLGTTKAVRDAEEADIAAFVFWRAGVPEWQPTR
jgi:prolyl oligopeptidase